MKTFKIEDISEKETCVAIVPIFKGLKNAEQLKVADVAQPQLSQRNHTLFMEGERLTKLFVIHSGHIKLVRTNSDGHEQIIRVLGSGEFVGEHAFLTGVRAKYSAVTLEETEMCVFDHSDIDTLFQRYPSVGLRMLEEMSFRLQETEARLNAAIATDVGTRVANYLLDLPATRDGHGRFVELPLPKKDIASLLDTTPESLSRQLRQFYDGEIIRQTGKRIYLVNIEALIDIAGEQ